MLLELKRFYIPPGQKVLLQNVDWSEFEAILEELGEKRAARIAYERETLGLPRTTELWSDNISKCLLHV